MINICTKCIILIRDIIWLNKTYGEYISIKYLTRTGTYIPQDEYEFYNWAHIQIDLVKNEARMKT